jgi:CpeT/CpcT family (DUF1001)
MYAPMNSLQTLARWMAGDFSNREQAFQDPAFFAQIRVCHRPLPYELLQGIGFYLEQAYDVSLDSPYRARVLHLVPQGEAICIRNYTLKDDERFWGAARQPERLQEITFQDLEKLEGCSYILQPDSDVAFKGTVEPGKACKVFRKGQETYLGSEIEIRENAFTVYERGFDPETDRQVWGSYAGPFEFSKWTDFSLEVPNL